MSPTSLATLNGFINYTWLLKPLYGYLADNTWVWGYRRKIGLVLFSLIIVSGWAMMGFWVSTIASVIISRIVTNIGLGLVDSTSQGIMVEFG